MCIRDRVKTAEFDKELDKRVADEKDKALKLAKLDFDSKYTKAVNDTRIVARQQKGVRDIIIAIANLV